MDHRRFWAEYSVLMSPKLLNVTGVHLQRTIAVLLAEFLAPGVLH